MVEGKVFIVHMRDRTAMSGRRGATEEEKREGAKKIKMTNTLEAEVGGSQWIGG